MGILESEIEKQTKQALPEGAFVSPQSEYPSIETVYYFDIITSHGINIQNQITDNYLENNTAVQDHIAHAPIMITLGGMSGELKYVEPIVKNDIAASIISKLGFLAFITPSVSNVTQLAMNIYNYADSSINRYSNIAKKFATTKNPLNALFGLTPTLKETRLQEIFRKLKLLRDTNTALVVNTPYATFENMYIQSLTLRQENVNYTTDIELTLKQLQFAEVRFDKVDETVMSKYNAIAQAKAEDNGKMNSKDSTIGKFISQFRGDKYYTAETYNPNL